jgi:Ca2+-binding RTX toxin-like protein
MSNRTTNPSTSANSSPAFFEELESRQLFAAGGPVSGPVLTPNTKVKLILSGTSKNDNIALDVKKGYLHFFLNGVTKRYSAARVGVVQVLAGKGDDTVKLGSGAPGVYIDGGDGKDNIVGGKRNDSLVGGAGNDTIVGGLGDDQITGGAGVDVLMGGGGQDNIKSNDLELDTVDGGDDFDTASLDLQDLFNAVERRLYP